MAKPCNIDITPRGYGYKASVTTACRQKESSYHFQLSNTTGRHEMTKDMQFHSYTRLFISSQSIIVLTVCKVI